MCGDAWREMALILYTHGKQKAHIPPVLHCSLEGVFKRGMVYVNNEHIHLSPAPPSDSVAYGSTSLIKRLSCQSSIGASSTKVSLASIEYDEHWHRTAVSYKGPTEIA